MAQHLNNHHPERSTHRLDKMSRDITENRKFFNNSHQSVAKRVIKKLQNKKRRQLLKKITDKI